MTTIDELKECFLLFPKIIYDKLPGEWAEVLVIRSFKLNHVFAYTDEIGRLKVHCHSFFVKKDLRNIIENYFIQQNTRMKKNQDKKFIHLLISII